MPNITLTSPNISCDHCARTIERELGDVPGVERVKVDVAARTVAIDWRAPATIGQIAQVLRDIDYPAENA